MRANPLDRPDAGPVAETARIDAIDVLRGFALLGILAGPDGRRPGGSTRRLAILAAPVPLRTGRVGLAVAYLRCAPAAAASTGPHALNDEILGPLVRYAGQRPGRRSTATSSF